jgi:hypothetical protein
VSVDVGVGGRGRLGVGRRVGEGGVGLDGNGAIDGGIGARRERPLGLFAGARGAAGGDERPGGEDGGECLLHRRGR